jgi:hypothetical protein
LPQRMRSLFDDTGVIYLCHPLPAEKTTPNLSENGIITKPYRDDYTLRRAMCNTSGSIQIQTAIQECLLI